MSTYSNTVNISAIPVAQEIIDGDYFVIKTAEGLRLIDFKDLPYAKIDPEGKVEVKYLLSAVNVFAYSSLSATSAYITDFFVDNFRGIDTEGVFNTFLIKEGIILSALNTQSEFIDSLSATTDTLLDAISARVPNVFYDSGNIFIEANQNAPIYQILVTGNSRMPDPVNINPSDIQVNYIWNNELENTYVNPVTQTEPVSAIPKLFIKESSTGNYQNGSGLIQFRAVFRPALIHNVIVSWNCIKTY